MKRRDLRFVVIASSVYAAVTLYMVLRHAPWRDEADAWLAARDMSLRQLWPWLHYVGSPGLWYLMLMPLAKLGLPYLCMNLLNWVMGVAAAILILSRAPFPKVVRVLLVASFYLPVEYSVIARPYATMSLLLILVACLYPRRYERPFTLAILLVLLANIGPHGTLFAAALSIAWGLDALLRRRWHKRIIISALIVAAGLLLAAIQVIPNPPDGQLAGAWVVRHPDGIDFILYHTFTPMYPHNEGHIMTRLYDSAYPLFLVAWLTPRLITAIFLCGTLFLLRRDPPLLIALLLAFAGVLYVFTFKHFGGDHHTGLLWLFIWVMLWIARTTFPGHDPAIWKWGAIPLAISSIYCIALTFHFLVMQTPYSGSRAAAEFLLAHHLVDRPIGMYEENRCEAILPYLGPKTVWYAGENRYGTYMTWNAQLEKDRQDIPAGIAALLKKSDAEPNMVLVFGTDLQQDLSAPYQLLFDNRKSPSVMLDERYAIYVRREQ